MTTPIWTLAAPFLWLWILCILLYITAMYYSQLQHKNVYVYTTFTVGSEFFKCLLIYICYFYNKMWITIKTKNKKYADNE